MEFVGKKIKKRRLSKKYSLEYVSSELKISQEIIKNIEDDSYISTNKDVFLLGHIRSYSVLLGLKPIEIIEEFKLQNAYQKIDIKDQIPKPLTNNSFNLKGTLSFASIIFLFLGFYYLFIDGENAITKYAIVPEIPVNLEPIIEKTIMNEQIAKQDNSNKIELNQINPANISSSSAVASSNLSDFDNLKKIITLKFTNPTWIQIRDSDDKIIISKLMKKNDEYTYEISSNYFLTAGNAGNIIVSIDNKVLGKVGDFGEVVDSVSFDSSFKN